MGENSNRFHLVLFTEEFYPDTSGGAFTRWHFARKAAERGVQVTIFTPRKEDTARSETVEGVRIIRPPSIKPSFVPVYSNFSIPFRIIGAVVTLLYALWWFYNREVDAIHSASHLFHWVGKLLSILYGVPLTNFMGYTPSVREEENNSLRGWLEKLNFLLFMGETVYCRKESVKRTLLSVGVNDARILHGILHREKIEEVSKSDETDVRTMHGISENETLVVFVGRFVPIKRPEAAVATIEELPSDFRLLMIGDGPELERIQRMVESRGLFDRVELTGQLSHMETLKRIKASDVLLLTSEAEAYPTVVFEALALGSHIVAPPIGILPSLSHERLHLVSEEGMADVLVKLDSGSYSIGDNVLADYSIERYTSEILERSSELSNKNI